MPGIYRVRCDACDYEVIGSSYLAVIMPNGTEEVCPHPGEIQHAERVTKEKWDTLVREGRIRYRYAMFCRACGAVDYYGPDHARRWPHLESLIYVPTPEEAQRYLCRTCGKDMLFPLCWEQWKLAISCPKCKTGWLISDMPEIS